MKDEDVEGEKPPPKYSFKSWRFLMSLLIMFGIFTRTAMRVNMSIAVVCMVNSSYTSNPGKFDGSKGFNLSEIEEYNNLTSSENSKCSLSNSDVSSASGYNGDLPWTQSQINTLFSANFYGILTSVGISGYFSDKFDPKKVILIATTNSVMWTLLIPTLSRISIWAVFLGRYLMGLGEGFIMPAMFSIASRWFPQHERSSFIAIYTSGNQIAAILTLPISSLLCSSEFFGWQSIFYFFGSFGFVWMTLWFFFATGSPEKHMFMTEREKNYIMKSLGKFHKKTKNESPWKLLLTSGAFWTAVTAQISFSFSVVLMQSYLPLFFKQVLKISLKKNGIFSVLPFCMQIITKNTLGNIGDFMKRKKILTNTQAVRIFQVVANSGTACCFMMFALFVDCDAIPLTLIVLTIYGCFISCGILGFYSSLLSIAPRFAGTVGSMSLFIASVVHSCVPMLVGFFNKTGTREEWRNIWLFAVGLHCIGGIIFGIFGTAEVQEWAKFIPEQENEKLKDLTVESNNEEESQDLDVESEGEEVKLTEIYQRRETDEL